MTLSEVRRKFLDFMQARGHALVPSASLVPENDPTTLFTGSGMQPMVPYLLGARHPLGSRVADSQKSFRAEDIEEVGDNRHTTFFEMLGNWSFGDYWKEEQLSGVFEFLIKELGLDPRKLYVSVFSGDPELGIPRDEDSISIWKKIFADAGVDNKYVELVTEAQGSATGMQAGRIFGYRDKNWWSRAGVPANMPAGEPGGPDSEMFYDFGPSASSGQVRHDVKFGKECHPNCDCGRFMEIGNSVFMEYKKLPDGSFEKLAQRNVDFGGGLERITAAANQTPDIFLANHIAIIKELERLTGTRYEDNLKACRIVADHGKAAMFLIADGVMPSNKDRGYFVRRLLRRSIVFLHKLQPGLTLTALVPAVVGIYESQYPEFAAKAKEITKELAAEEAKFVATLDRGMREFEKGLDAFTLFTTYGFPLELIKELAAERGTTIDEVQFANAMREHQELSRTASAGMFKGGLADASEATTRLHTTHHLLLKALQLVLGPQVKQRGSNITQERLRIDFSHGAKMTEEQKKEVERIVNEKIAEDLPMTRTEMPLAAAEQLGAEHEFGQKYPERVSVYSLGPKDATPANPKFKEAFSIEFCGGPHVNRTSEIKGAFRIAKEEAVSAGIRRIKGVLE